jgi:hypothetical protein
MDIDELERRTHEQIRDIQEEYNQRIAPLIKILSEIRIMRPITFTLREAEYMRVFGSSTWDNPEYQRAQAKLNSMTVYVAGF